MQLSFTSIWLFFKICCFHNLVEYKWNESGDFRVTHQAPANRWSLFSSMVSFVAHFHFCGGRKDVRAPCVKIMTTNSAVARWVIIKLSDIYSFHTHICHTKCILKGESENRLKLMDTLFTHSKGKTCTCFFEPHSHDFLILMIIRMLIHRF